MAELQEVREALTLDLWMEPSALALNEVGEGLGMRFGWQPVAFAKTGDFTCT